MNENAQFHKNLLAANEALLLGALRQHELSEAAESLNAQLQEEITGRKRVEAALRESEKRYRNLFNSIDEGFCVIEKIEGGVGEPPDFLYLEANPAFAAQSGMSGMVGKTIRQMLPDEPEGWCLIYDTVLRSGEPIRFEREFVTHGRVLELYAFRVEDETHRRVAVIFKDITERKLADEARARLAAIVNSSNDAIIGNTLNSVITSWNAGAERLFGYTAQEAIGQSVAMLIPRERLDEEAGILERIRRGARVDNFETVRCRKDGTTLDVSLTISPIVDSLGNLVGASKIARDITGRKQAEKKLRESEGRFRAIAENIPQLAWMADGEGCLDWFNLGWLEYTGTTLQENLGGGWKAVHHPDYVDAAAEKFERHLREGLDWEDTFPLRGKDGNYRWFLSRMNVIRDESGKVLRSFGTSTDITNEREAEERQRLLTNELAHRGKNLLAVVLSIASRSLSGTRSLAETRDVLIQRLHALARNQSLLITQGFEGAPLAEIVRLEFESFSERVTAVGPHVMVNPRVAQTFALVVHELATNATKHGALSEQDGHIEIRWSIEGVGAEAMFKFQWQEFDGPLVVKPTRQGFGRVLLEKAVAQEFGAPAKINFAPEGLRYEIGAPLSVVTAGSSGAEGTGVFKLFAQV